MKKSLYLLLLSWLVVFGLSATTREVKLKLVETSDIHGNYFPYNFIEKHPWDGSFARIHAFVQQARAGYGDNLLLFDNGDLLQGQPAAYYFNFMDTVSTHLAAEMMNYMGYNAGNMGNHDVEAGRSVFDRWIRDCRFPVLGANILNASDGTPYLKPYEVIEREGVRVVVLGMITPAIPVWLPETLWKGLSFEDMETTARKWMRIIREKENPDLVVGLFHAGNEARTMAGKYREDASEEIARRVPGFDIVMMGHDHRRHYGKIVNAAGDTVVLINPASNGRVVGDIDVSFLLENGKVKQKQIEGRLTEVAPFGVSEAFMARFAPSYKEVEDFVSRRIGTFTDSLSTRPAYFGPSAFIDLIHTLQLALTGADVSFAAPLSFDARIHKGEVAVSDMFSLYKYENMLYTMRLSGAEIKGFLEESYAMWTNRMQSPGDHLLLLKPEQKGAHPSFLNYSFNFDSAAGLRYTVDVTRPKGEKVTILGMADGTPFDSAKMYKVALNSYRGNGGGELLTKGAGIPHEKLKERILQATDKDLRYYLIRYIEEKKVLDPQPLGQWKFIPETWTRPAAHRDSLYLFGQK